jgi:F-type H+-transporting ATPase subunit b
MTFNLWTFLFEAVNFVVLAYVLHRLLYRPLHQAVEQRHEANARARAEAEKAQQAAAATQERLRAELGDLERRRQETIREAREQGEADRRRLLAEAEAILARRQEEARRALDRERDEALRALRSELVTQAIELSRRLLREASDSSLQRQLALRLAETLDGLPADERERIRVHWQSEDGTVLETARELDAALVARLSEAVSALVGQPVALAVRDRPALLGGVRLRVGGHVWDASVAGQLEAVNPGGAEVPEPCPSAASS